MAGSVEYQSRISQLDRAGLLRLWDRIKEGQTQHDDWPAGMAFEYLILRAFQLEDAQVEWPYTVPWPHEPAGGETPIEQIDGIVYWDGLACLVESKDHAARVDVVPIAKLRSQLLRRPAATIGSVFSRGDFSESATLLASFMAPQTILLWTGEEVDFALQKERFCRGLVAKYRHCVKDGFVSYNISVEDVS